MRLVHVFTVLLVCTLAGSVSVKANLKKCPEDAVRCGEQRVAACCCLLCAACCLLLLQQALAAALQSCIMQALAWTLARIPLLTPARASLGTTAGVKHVAMKMMTCAASAA
jgi:hypothetical protein